MPSYFILHVFSPIHSAFDVHLFVATNAQTLAYLSIGGVSAVIGLQNLSPTRRRRRCSHRIVNGNHGKSSAIKFHCTGVVHALRHLISILFAFTSIVFILIGLDLLVGSVSASFVHWKSSAPVHFYFAPPTMHSYTRYTRHTQARSLTSPIESEWASVRRTVNVVRAPSLRIMFLPQIFVADLVEYTYFMFIQAFASALQIYLQKHTIIQSL